MIRSLTPWRARVPRTISRFEEEMEGLMDRFLGQGEEWGTPTLRFTPRVNVAETDNEFEVTMDLPGLKPEEVRVELKEGSLWVSGEKSEEEEEKGKTFHRLERRYGEFHRVIPLATELEEEKIQAAFKEGVLTITIPKSEKVKPKRIEVKS